MRARDIVGDSEISLPLLSFLSFFPSLSVLLQLQAQFFHMEYSHVASPIDIAFPINSVKGIWGHCGNQCCIRGLDLRR